MASGIEKLLVGYEGVFERCVEVDFCEDPLRRSVLLLFVQAGICHDGPDLVLEAFDRS
jgi:hypothetical protein